MAYGKVFHRVRLFGELRVIPGRKVGLKEGGETEFQAEFVRRHKGGNERSSDGRD